jgi:hypothetical protein
MADQREPYQIIADMVAAHASTSDADILAELAALPPFPDEDDPAWERAATWQMAEQFFALAQVAATRRLKPAIRLLLDRACYGDPGEMFRGLRHACEAIVDPRWSELADICLEAATSPRLGTRLWAIAQLTVLEDERARSIFEESTRNDPQEIRWRAEGGLKRLDAARSRST